MKKVFRMRTDHLRVTVTQDDTIYIPSETGQEAIGTYEQTTIQKINLSDVDKLHKFVKDEYNKATKRRDELKGQLEEMDGVDENIDEEFIQTTTKALKKTLDKENFWMTQGNSEVFDNDAHQKATTELIALNKYFQDVTRKKSIQQQLEHIGKQLDGAGKELKDLEESMK